MSKKKSIISQEQTKEIFWNIVSAGLSGLLVLLGSFTTNGEINSRGLFTAIVTALIVAATEFKDYWKKEEGEYCPKKNYLLFSVK